MATGQCPGCNTPNEYSEICCTMCGQRLPWAAQAAAVRPAAPKAAPRPAPAAKPPTIYTAKNIWNFLTDPKRPSLVPLVSSVGCIGCGGLFAIMLVLTLIHDAIFGRQFSDGDAYEMAETAVRAKLKAPSTAVFESITDTRIDRNFEKTDHIIGVNGHVDAQNSFGAMLHSSYSVIIDVSADGKTGTVESAKLDGEQ